jgi:ethanolamine transporter EutH
MVYDGSYVPYMMLGKVVSGICAVILALFIYKKEDQIAEGKNKNG